MAPLQSGGNNELELLLRKVALTRDCRRMKIGDGGDGDDDDDDEFYGNYCAASVATYRTYYYRTRDPRFPPSIYDRPATILMFAHPHR